MQGKGPAGPANCAADLGRLRTLATPEMVSYFADDLAGYASRGLVNECGDVKLLQGDLAEAWREGNADYATVAMRYSLTDVTVNSLSRSAFRNASSRAFFSFSLNCISFNY